jgi:hypothetical protein
MTAEDTFAAFIARVDSTGVKLAHAADAEPEKLGDVFDVYKALAEAFFKTVRLVSKLPDEVVTKAMNEIEAEDKKVIVAH